MTETQLIHFVGFRGEEYHSAVKVWGKPDFIHMGHDNRMRRETASYDTIVTANGYETRLQGRYNYPDMVEHA